MQNILVIDDSEFDRRMIVSAMRSACRDARCFELSEGQAVLDVMRSETPSLTILDIRMPGMSGWEVLDEIKSDRILCNSNVVMMSGSHSEEDIEMAALKGAAGFYTKPHKRTEYHLVAADLKKSFLNTAS